jgi:hypothetical protein
MKPNKRHTNPSPHHGLLRLPVPGSRAVGVFTNSQGKSPFYILELFSKFSFFPLNLKIG